MNTRFFYTIFLSLLATVTFAQRFTIAEIIDEGQSIRIGDKSYKRGSKLNGIGKIYWTSKTSFLRILDEKSAFDLRITPAFLKENNCTEKNLIEISDELKFRHANNDRYIIFANDSIQTIPLSNKNCIKCRLHIKNDVFLIRKPIEDFDLNIVDDKIIIKKEQFQGFVGVLSCEIWEILSDGKNKSIKCTIEII